MIIDRRNFIQTSTGLLLGSSLISSANPDEKKEPLLQPIRGSWFEFQHCWKHESGYWDSACAAFSCEQWKQKVQEMSDLGLRYLVLLSVAQDEKTFYPSELFTSWELECSDPLEAVLSVADEKGMRIFISSGFFDERIGTLAGPDGVQKRFQAMEEIVDRYGHHAGFYGWYWPNEAELNPYFTDEFIHYCNQSSEFARRLTPKAKILIAPYGTRRTLSDDRYAKQLENLNVDIVAYQDEVGVRKTRVDELDAIFSRLRTVHNRVPQVALWADMEIFDFEGGTYKSNLIPAPFSRIDGQLAAISPHVDTILVYQYQGMMNQPESKAFAGHPSSTQLYSDYRAWCEINGFLESSPPGSPVPK